MVILAAEIKTKTESRFKEAFIAFLSLPEACSWATLVAFMYYSVQLSLPFYLASAALLVYVTMNTVHAVVLPKLIVPNSFFSYKQIMMDYKNNTNFVYFISCVLSYKFSLILVSYFWLRPQYKGDYSAASWMVFNKIGLVFICIPYPAMMVACCVFLVQQGMFSYTGFLCIEVIIVSSVMAVLMLLDAISALKCKVVGKGKENQKVRSKFDGESDEEDKNLKKVLNRKKTSNGADEMIDSKRSEVDEETRR